MAVTLGVRSQVRHQEDAEEEWRPRQDQGFPASIRCPGPARPGSYHLPPSLHYPPSRLARCRTCGAGALGHGGVDTWYFVAACYSQTIGPSQPQAPHSLHPPEPSTLESPQVQGITDEEWRVTEAARNLSENNISHKFWSTKKAMGLEEVTRMFSCLLPGEISSRLRTVVLQKPRRRPSSVDTFVVSCALVRTMAQETTWFLPRRHVRPEHSTLDTLPVFLQPTCFHSRFRRQSATPTPKPPNPKP